MPVPSDPAAAALRRRRRHSGSGCGDARAGALPVPGRGPGPPGQGPTVPLPVAVRASGGCQGPGITGMRLKLPLNSPPDSENFKGTMAQGGRGGAVQSESSTRFNLS